MLSTADQVTARVPRARGASDAWGSRVMGHVSSPGHTADVP